MSRTRDDRITPRQQHTIGRLASFALIERRDEIRSALQEEPAVVPFMHERLRRWHGVRFAHTVLFNSLSVS